VTPRGERHTNTAPRPPGTSARCRGVAALAVLLSLLGAISCGFSEEAQVPDPAAADPPAEALGYGLPVNAYEMERDELERALDLAEEAGVTSISTGAVWWHIAPQPSPDSYNWEGLDRLVAQTQSRNMRLNVQISGTPDWVHPWLVEDVPDPVRRRWYPPRGPESLRQFQGFVRALVERYGTRIDRYEVWNEPNLKHYWEPASAPGEYAALLRAAYTAIKEVEPEATVVSGGLARNHVGFLKGYYAVARGYPGAAENDYFFDVLGLHPYTRGPDGTAHSPDWSGPERVIQTRHGPLDFSFGGIAEMRRVMEENGDHDKPIYIGEFGYSTVDIPSFGLKGIPDPKRALYLKRAYALARDLPYVEEIVWYAYLPTADNAEWSIVGPELNSSATFRALRQATGAEGERPVDVSVPRKPVSDVVSLDAELDGGGPTSSWELYVDGFLVGTYDDAPLEWDARNVAAGEHDLLVAAYTTDGNVWTSDSLRVTVAKEAA